MMKIILISTIFFLFFFNTQAFSYEGTPEIITNGYKIEKFITGLNVPIALDFIDNDIFVLQKNDGMIRLIQDEVLHEQPILDLEVSNYGEQGLLGITAVENKIYVFYTQAFHDGGISLGNKIYEYTWENDELSKPKLIKSLPGWVQGYNAGTMTHDLENNILAVSGSQYKFGSLQNFSFEESSNCKTDKTTCYDEHKLTFSDSIMKTISCMLIEVIHLTLTI